MEKEFFEKINSSKIGLLNFILKTLNIIKTILKKLILDY